MGISNNFIYWQLLILIAHSSALIIKRCQYKKKSLANYQWLIQLDRNGYKVRIQVSECQAISCRWDTSKYNHKWIQGENTSVRASCKFQWLPSAHAGITPFAHIWALLARASHPDVRFKLQYFNSISVIFEFFGTSSALDCITSSNRSSLRNHSSLLTNVPTGPTLTISYCLYNWNT